LDVAIVRVGKSIRTAVMKKAEAFYGDVTMAIMSGSGGR
jgi:hypothetical protein